MMVLATHHASNTRKEALDEVRVNAIATVSLGVVDPVSAKQDVQRVPMRCFIGKQCGVAVDDVGNKLYSVRFMSNDRRKNSTPTFTGGNNHSTLTCLVPSQASIPTVLLKIGFADVSADIAAVNLNFAGQLGACVL